MMTIVSVSGWSDDLFPNPMVVSGHGHHWSAVRFVCNCVYQQYELLSTLMAENMAFPAGDVFPRYGVLLRM